MQFFNSLENNLFILLPFWIGTLIFLFFKKSLGWKFDHVQFSNCLGRGRQTSELYQQFGFIFHMWRCYEEWAHYYLGISPQYYLTLVHHFRYFVIFGYSQHSWSLIDWISWVSYLVLAADFLRVIWFFGLRTNHFSSFLV